MTSGAREGATGARQSREAAFVAGHSHFAAGDPLRAVAALAVFVYHLFWEPQNFREIYGFAGYVFLHLDLGFYLFFVLSGYLVLRPFVSASITSTDMPSYVAHMRRRLIRIVLPFWAIFLLVYVRHAFFGNYVGVDLVRGVPISRVLSIPLFLQEWLPSKLVFLLGQAWTLAVEIQFYAVAPLVLLLGVTVSRRAWSHATEPTRALWIVGGALAAGAASVAVRAAVPDTHAWQRSFPAMGLAFVPGIVLAAIEHLAVPRLRDHVGLARRWSWTLLAAGLVALVPYHIIGGMQHESVATLPASRAPLAAFSMGCVLAAFLVREWAGDQPALARVGFLRWTGARSYSLYLVHTAVLFEFATLWTTLRPAIRSAALLAVGLPVTLSVTYLFHRFVEATALQLARRAHLVGRRTRSPADERDHAEMAP